LLFKEQLDYVKRQMMQ